MYLVGLSADVLSDEHLLPRVCHVSGGKTDVTEVPVVQHRYGKKLHGEKY